MKRHSGHGVGGWVGIIIYLVIGFVTPFLIPDVLKAAAAAMILPGAWRLLGGRT